MSIERISQELERIVSPDQELERLSEGYGCAEGPVWWQEGGYLVFNDIPGDKRMKWSPEDGTTVIKEPTGNANGLTRDLQGRLIICEHGTRSVTRLEQDGTVTVVADRFEGKRLNRPNDVVVKSDGSIYFTDPGAPEPGLDLDFAGVYRVSADLSSIKLLIRDFILPNGLAFSPDESILYIDDSRGPRHIRAFDIQPDGTLSNDRVFCELVGERSGAPDGMKVDVEGNVYCTGPGGAWIIDPSGKHLGTILTEAKRQTTNVAWGGEDWKTLYITTLEAVSRLRLKIPGIPVPLS